MARMIRTSNNRRMNMKTQNEISLLADQELDAVVGGRMATGRDPKPCPGGVAGFVHNQVFEGLAIGGGAGLALDLVAIALFL
jgi:hypothetical protein